MDFPELPDMDLPIKEIFTCPACRKSIAAFAVKSRFSCPNCQRKLISNIEDAWRYGAKIGVGTFIALAIILNLVNSERFAGLWFLLYGGSGILAFYTGYFLYRSRVVIRSRR